MVRYPSLTPSKDGQPRMDIVIKHRMTLEELAKIAVCNDWKGPGMADQFPDESADHLVEYAASCRKSTRKQFMEEVRFVLEFGGQDSLLLRNSSDDNPEELEAQWLKILREWWGLA